jgi:Holliday junction DNA helicase RuvA
LPGIGKKTAERLIVEMKDKISEISSDENSLSQNNENSAVAEAINALVNLGYKTKDAKTILDKIESEGLTVEELIRQALKSLNK